MHLRCVSCYGLTAQRWLSSAQLSSAWGGCDRQVAKWEQVGKELKAKLEQARQPRLQRAALSLLRLQDETISYIIVCFVLIQSARLPTGRAGAGSVRIDAAGRRRASCDRRGAAQVGGAVRRAAPRACGARGAD